MKNCLHCQQAAVWDELGKVVRDEVSEAKAQA